MRRAEQTPRDLAALYRAGTARGAEVFKAREAARLEAAAARAREVGANYLASRLEAARRS